MLVDLHNHTPRCNHAEGELYTFVEKAIENGCKYYGFSDHAPMNFDKKYRMDVSEMSAYEDDILTLKEKYKDKINILLGYEVDYLDGYILDEVLSREVDYFIGSVHFVDKWGFDNPEFIGEYENKDLDAIWEEYFKAVKNLAKSGKFDIVGHLDLIKIFKYYPSKNIVDIAEPAINAIKDAGMSVEINLAGFRKPVNEQYPSRNLLKLVYEKNIPITFGSDAHRVGEVGLNRELGVHLAKDLGFKKCAIYENRSINLINF